MRADEEGEFREFVSVRLQPLRRSAYLLCGDRHGADDLVAIAIGKLFRSWRRVNRMDRPDACRGGHGARPRLTGGAGRARRRQGRDGFAAHRRGRGALVGVRDIAQRSAPVNHGADLRRLRRGAA